MLGMLVLFGFLIVAALGLFLSRSPAEPEQDSRETLHF